MLTHPSMSAKNVKNRYGKSADLLKTGAGVIIYPEIMCDCED